MLATVEKIGPALDLFTAETPEWGVTEVALALRAPKSSTHALLVSMADIGLLERTAGARYRLGWRLLSLSRTLVEGTAYRAPAARAMRNAVDRCGEAMHLAVLERGEVVYVDSVRGANASALPTGTGTRLPAHPTGVGKVLLAHRGEAEARRAVGGAGLRGFTPNTIVSHERLRAELERVRRVGVAFDREETIAGLCCVAAPIRDDGGTVVAAVSVSAPRADSSGARPSSWHWYGTSPPRADQLPVGRSARATISA